MSHKDPVVRAEYNKQYYKDNRKEINIKHKQYRQTPEAQVKRKQYNKDNSKKIKAKVKQNYQDHREERLASAKQNYQDNREKRLVQQKQYKKDHPEVDLKHKQKMYKNMGLTPYDLMAWAKVIRKGKNCSYCGSDKDLHSHHIFPKSKYKDLALSENNGTPLCATCHRIHHSLNGVTA
tara:strand:- start:246 stop:779 length:534 start_codon:yes stop_codon:yes gene_type:complete